MYFLKHTNEEIKNFLVKNNFKSFRLKQIFEWIYKKNISSFDDMTNLSVDLRKSLNTNFKLFSLKLKKCIVSENKQTKKYLFELPDGFLIESVLIFSDKRKTICLSTQVGCRVKCTFCASGKKGFFRNLKSHEIIEQILLVSKDINQKPSHIVFMGMGEPLMNLEELLRAIRKISCDHYLNISQRRITISTVGILENLKKLKEENLRVNLALSLHAPTDEIRNQIIPYSKRYKISDLISELASYFKKTKRDISFEYILIKDVNDSIQDANNLAKLLKNFQCSINLIPYNPIKGLNYKKPSNTRILEFKTTLISKKLNVTQRYTKGDDIAAACGQLACLNDNSLLKFKAIN